MTEPKEVRLSKQVVFARIDGGAIVVNVNGRECHISPAKWAEIVAELQAE